MFIHIVQHTPAWVWALLAGLVAMGLSQTRDRTLTLQRATLQPLIMAALSLAGLLSAFGPAPIALGCWGAGIALALALSRRYAAARGARWSAETGTLHVPGSWLPLVLMMGLFGVKYLAGASLALHPGLAGDPVFAGACGLAYGAFSGIFAARARSLRALAAPQAGRHAMA